MGRLWREFLDTKRQEDQDHDPTQNRKHPIGTGTTFRNFEIPRRHPRAFRIPLNLCYLLFGSVAEFVTTGIGPHQPRYDASQIPSVRKATRISVKKSGQRSGDRGLFHRNSSRPCENHRQRKDAVTRGERYEIFVVLGAGSRLMPRERPGKGCYRPIESDLGHFQAAIAFTMASTPRIFSARRRL
jgi:hypothetical protein